MIKHQSQEYALASISETLQEILVELKKIGKGIDDDRIARDNNKPTTEDKKQVRGPKKSGTTSSVTETGSPS